MTEQYPISGGKLVIRPDGTSERVTFRDEPTTADERKELAKYDSLSPLEIVRRLRAAEWNAEVYRGERDQWKAIARKAEDELELAQRKLASITPDGYDVPKIVAELIAHAATNGWRTALAWTPREDDMHLAVHVGRETTPADGATRGWYYKLAWSCVPGSARKAGTGLARTPDRPQWHDGPSVKSLRHIIAAHPAP
ncbi:hypothetical protein [Streptomyces europaeiscabiei]|uniref:hypothetical protein n=1 Tax=Streptomyces europaeiscabiei TaxID=146819 RepID=UPI0038F807B5